MYSFRNDYSELAANEVFEFMMKSLNEQNIGYGLDKHTLNAKKLIRKHIKNDVEIHLLVGGTSCNKIIISHILKPYEAVIAPDSGHINVHEAGAIEANGHKIITVPAINGKITLEAVKEICSKHIDEHMVIPKMVYISNSTETGSIYTKSELEALYQLCKVLDLYLFIDGARLGLALTAESNDLSLNDVANLCDVFYIGGTKNGALLGEAVVLVNPNIRDNFRHSIKQNGGMLAKGFLLGIQFEALFENNLYFKLAYQANQKAKRLKEKLQDLNVQLAFDSPTNQQFITLSKNHIQALQENYDFEIWDDKGEEATIRLVTSWATSEEAVDKFIEDLKIIIKK
jgi:threonine aldolase